MAWDPKMTAKKNPFIEALVNFRDFLPERFRFTSRNSVPIFLALVGFPALIVWGGNRQRVPAHSPTLLCTRSEPAAAALCVVADPAMCAVLCPQVHVDEKFAREYPERMRRPYYEIRAEQAEQRRRDEEQEEADYQEEDDDDEED